MAKAKAKMHEQYYVGVIKRFEVENGDPNYYNALMWYPTRKPGARYVKTIEEAKRVLNYAYKLWNGTKVYDSDGKRIETSEIGNSGLGISIVSTKDDDRRQEIVKHIIQKRMVSDWDTVEEA